jgi:Domain of unknown function (DUF4388)
MALEGTLKDFSLADIFQLIGLQRKTGVLTLRGKDDTVTVTFLDGKVVAADSLNKRLENRLGSVLVKTGRLTAEQLNHALEIQRETLQRLGFILTHYNIISQDSLRAALNLQIMQIVYRLFRWKDGEYHFSQETTIEYDRENVVPISAESILMEGARMIDEWPIIEKRIRSYDMVFRRKAINQEIVVGEADEISFDDTTTKKRKTTATEKIRISEEEKSIYDMVDGKLKVGDIIEMSRFAEFDTVKTLYELLTRDLIEEVRDTTTTRAVVEAAPIDQTAPTEVPPLPLPLVIVLGALALLSLATAFHNPANSLGPFGRPRSAVTETRKAISLWRIQTISDAIQAYSLGNARLPMKLQDLTPAYLSPVLLNDPWGNAYKYLQKPERYLVIGFTPDGKPDTDLFLSRSIEGSATLPANETPGTGGIVLIEDGSR